MTFILTDVLNMASKSNRTKKVWDVERTFQARWMNLYFCTWMNRAICLICSEAVSAAGDFTTLNVCLCWTDCSIHKRTIKLDGLFNSQENHYVGQTVQFTREPLSWTDCSIHNRTIKSLKAESVKTVVKVANLIFSKGPNDSEFQDSVHSLKTEFEFIVYCCEVWWLSNGKKLK
jgi:hypothetical protein